MSDVPPPKYRKKIICLANSRKTTGRCVAGKEVIDGAPADWIRPVSRRDSGELSEEERRYQNGQDPKLLDIIVVPCAEPRPHQFQQENHLIDDKYYWTKVGEADWTQLQAALDNVPGVLWDNTSSSYNGQHDRVIEATANTLTSSLRLIPVEDLVVEVLVEGAEFGNGKRKVRGTFTLNGHSYRLAITDPIVERKYLAGNDGEFRIGRAILSISLGEPYGGYAYKLIAGVFLPV